jgi:NTP pyrophosphatase (non-canonical NTP hydrolase)
VKEEAVVTKQYSDSSYVHVEDGTGEAVEEAVRFAHAQLDHLVKQLDEAKRRREAGLDSVRLNVVMPPDPTKPAREPTWKDDPVGGITFGSLVAEADAWQRKTFPGATPTSAVLHLASEIGEYVASIAASPADASFLVDDLCARIRAGSKKGRGETAEEIADALFLVIQMASANDVDLTAAFTRKLAKNKARAWKKPDAQGVVEHEREGG